LVMSEGRIVHETRAEDADVTVMGKYMAGHEHHAHDSPAAAE
jgi:hypothetical protein